MKSIDIRSLLIGVLATVVVVLSPGLQRQDRDTVAPRYQFCWTENGIIVLDNQTLIVTRLARKSDAPGDIPQVKPYLSDQTWSLTDAIAKKGGAEMRPGVGH